MQAVFDAQRTLISDALVLRPLTGDDREGLYAAAGDPLIWAGHPATTRHLRAVFDPYFDNLLVWGGTLALTERHSGRIIGCSRFYAAPDQPEDISIGFTFLVRDHWGGPTNFAVKRLMLDHAFGSFDRVWFHIAPTNLRSQKATGKLGAVLSHTVALNLTGTPVETACLVLSRAAWARVSGDRPESGLPAI